jgi:hypothetical protein
MTVQNLANVLGPTLLAPNGAPVEDTGAQIRIAETIITYAKDMFELGNLPIYPLTSQKRNKKNAWAGLSVW